MEGDTGRGRGRGRGRDWNVILSCIFPKEVGHDV